SHEIIVHGAPPDGAPPAACIDYVVAAAANDSFVGAARGDDVAEAGADHALDADKVAAGCAFAEVNVPPCRRGLVTDKIESRTAAKDASGGSANEAIVCLLPHPKNTV